MSWDVDFECGAVYQGQVDDPGAALQPGHRGRRTAESFTEVGKCPGAVFTAETDECAGAPPLG
ncbi:hypothetical protein Srubr_37130 [Streptomyces rubradiris]|uniref:Uncharacterized protein n=1 Tax=Streptomyces rubradiris TaxID=285531 RepID=A0ABQ3RDJ3_STRRR|nr:hypothetical protein GCM10018792_06040 [Streptomyces rubradiris]GHI53867.1 hypothetical protein Srubr_37130 [Streptomyces rubradiris]